MRFLPRSKLHIALSLLVVLSASLTVFLTTRGATQAAPSASLASWSTVSSPPIPGSTTAQLNAVAAISSSDVWAVGEYAFSSGINVPLKEHWDGTAWSIDTSQNSGPDSVLNGVTAVSSSNVWAVGFYIDAQNNDFAMIEHWNGTAWSVAPSPNAQGDLKSISAVSATDIWAVGAGAGNALIEHWDGTSWSVVPPPNNPSGSQSELDGVTAISSRNVWAVGTYQDGQFASHPLVERLRGSVWSIVQSPDALGTSSSWLNSVDAVSATDIWAVGTGVSTATGNVVGFIQQWNGVQWSNSPVSPQFPSNPGTPFWYLFGVTARSRSDVWAVGDFGTDVTGDMPLTLHYDGTSWSFVPSAPLQGNSQQPLEAGRSAIGPLIRFSGGCCLSTLFGVTAISSQNVWAVGRLPSGGTSGGSPATSTLIEHYGPRPTPYGKPLLTSTATSTPPAPTTSRYMATVDTATLMSEGQAQAQSGESGIVVLDFGQPLILKNVYGACLFISNACFRSTDQIASAAEAFLMGYASAASSGQFLTLAIGTSNFGSDVTTAHGQAWAAMVNQVGQWVATQGFTNREQVAGASDIEMGWNSAATTRAWADGYNASFNPSLQFGYFDYGDAAGCPTKAAPVDGSCNNGWHQSDVVYISWDVRAAYPLPEIYTVAGSRVQQANQWHSLSLYSHHHPGPYGPMFIEGSFTQDGACHSPGHDCDPSVDNTPQQGWQLLYNALNGDMRTAQPLPFSSDITYVN